MHKCYRNVNARYSGLFGYTNTSSNKVCPPLEDIKLIKNGIDK